MLGLGFPEIAGGLDLGHDLAGPQARGLDVGDRVLGDLTLLLARVEDLRAVAGADVVALAVLVVGSWIWKKNSRMSRYEMRSGSKTISTASAWPSWFW